MGESFGPLDSVLFTLVIVATAGAGLFQGWFEGFAQQDAEHKSGLALPRGKGPILDFLYMIILSCSVPFVLGNCDTVLPQKLRNFSQVVLPSQICCIMLACIFHKQ